MLINGEWVAASDGCTFDSVNPATGEVWARFPAATTEDVDHAVRTASAAGSTGPWAAMTPTERGHCLRKLGDLLAEHSEHLGKTECIDTGKLFSETRRQAKTSHPLVARVSFTGGPETARHIIKNSADNFAEVSLELGGKSPFIVFDDANIESAVNGSVAGIFGASGQSCVAGSRLYLHNDIADEFLERIVTLANGIRIGNPMDSNTEMGPLCTAAQVARVKEEIAIATDQGGRVLCGGKQPDNLSGHYFEPTVIECPQQSMQIVDTELFAPVLSVVGFSTEDEVIAMANDSKHGLAAGIFTRDSARSLRMVKAIKAGIVWVNTYRVISPIAEFGGMKNSGFGRESGFQAMYDYTRPKTVWMNLSDEPLSSPFQPR